MPKMSRTIEIWRQKAKNRSRMVVVDTVLSTRWMFEHACYLLKPPEASCFV